LVSLQKEPGSRPSASELLKHPFILKFNDKEGELLEWLQYYLKLQQSVKSKNLSMEVDLEGLGLADCIGLKE